MSEHVADDCLAMRVTKYVDATAVETKVTIHSILRLAAQLHLEIHIWVSSPCTLGCTWRNNNAAQGIDTGDIQLTEKLVKAACEIARHVYKLHGHVHWEWPKNNRLWDMPMVKKTLNDVQAEATEVSTAVAGLKFGSANTHIAVQTQARNI